MDVITFPENLYTISGLSILLHGVITLPELTPYDYAVFAAIGNFCHLLIIFTHWD